MSKDVDLGKELARANQEIRHLRRIIGGHERKWDKANPIIPNNVHEGPKEPEIDQMSSSQPHFVGPWQHYCATCGGTNPNFKDETECADCHMHLGSAEVAPTLKACPNCGGTEAKKIVK